MAWFIALFGTVAGTVAFAGAGWIARHFGLPFLADGVAQLLPLPDEAPLVALAVVGGQGALYLGLRWFVGHQLRFERFETEVAPLPPAPWLGFGRMHWVNPAGEWLILFFVPVAIAVAMTAPMALLGAVPAGPWGLAALFAATLAATARWPDPPWLTVASAGG